MDAKRLHGTPATRECVSCGRGLSASNRRKDGLCLQCRRERGELKTFAMEQARQARLQQLRPAMPAPVPGPKPLRTVTIHHREYEIVWDGSVR